MTYAGEKNESVLDVASNGKTVLAVGGELKNTVCLLEDQKAYLSQCHGDLKSLEEYEAFQESVTNLPKNHQSEPDLLVHDLHPEYLSTKWAKDQGVPLLGVQHHHAHLAACLAENQLNDPVIGIIMDGTGFGTDGTIWGAEILIGDYNGFERFASFELMPLPGGDKAVMEPWRTGVGYLTKTFGEIPELPFLQGKNYQIVQEITQKGINTPLTSSCGRLFDAVSAICGVRDIIEYEAQAAIEFMLLAENAESESYSIHLKEDHEGVLRLLISPLIREVVVDSQNKSLTHISSRFHATLAAYFQQIAEKARAKTGINEVVLSGGVFQNTILLGKTVELLKHLGLKVHTHKQLSANDSAISLGQAMIGREYLKKN